MGRVLALVLSVDRRRPLAGGGARRQRGVFPGKNGALTEHKKHYRTLQGDPFPRGSGCFSGLARIVLACLPDGRPAMAAGGRLAAWRAADDRARRAGAAHGATAPRLRREIAASLAAAITVPGDRLCWPRARILHPAETGLVRRGARPACFGIATRGSAVSCGTDRKLIGSVARRLRGVCRRTGHSCLASGHQVVRLVESDQAAASVPRSRKKSRSLARAAPGLRRRVSRLLDQLQRSTVGDRPEYLEQVIAVVRRHLGRRER